MDWLPDFVAQHAASQSKLPREASALGAMRLFGTIGSDVFLTPSGDVWALAEVGDGEEWTPLTNVDRNAAICVALKRFPELVLLLPRRPTDASDCSTCQGAGRLREMTCHTCGGLGWVA